MTQEILKFQKLNPYESVQMRPGMYINNLFDLFRFPFDRAVTNFKKGDATKIEVTLGKKSIKIQDDSKMNEAYFKNDMEYLFDTNVCTFTKPVDNKEIRPHRALCLSYMWVVNALCKKLTVAYKNGDVEYYCRFKNQELKQRKDKVKLQDGFMTKLKIDMSRFVGCDHELSTREQWLEKLKEHLLHTAKLNEGLSISFKDSVNDTTELFHFNSSIETIFKNVFGDIDKDKYNLITGKDDSERPLSFSVAYETGHECDFDFVSYVNDFEVIDGGVHIRDFKRFLIEEEGLSEDLKGVKAVFLLNMSNPEFTVSEKSLSNRSLKNRIYELLKENQ